VRLGAAILNGANPIRDGIAETLLPGLCGSVYPSFASRPNGIVRGVEEAG